MRDRQKPRAPFLRGRKEGETLLAFQGRHRTKATVRISKKTAEMISQQNQGQNVCWKRARCIAGSCLASGCHPQPGPPKQRGGQRADLRSTRTRRAAIASFSFLDGDQSRKSPLGAHCGRRSAAGSRTVLFRRNPSTRALPRVLSAFSWLAVVAQGRLGAEMRNWIRMQRELGSCEAGPCSQLGPGRGEKAGGPTASEEKRPSPPSAPQDAGGSRASRLAVGGLLN